MRSSFIICYYISSTLQSVELIHLAKIPCPFSPIYASQGFIYQTSYVTHLVLYYYIVLSRQQTHVYVMIVNCNIYLHTLNSISSHQFIFRFIRRRYNKLSRILAILIRTKENIFYLQRNAANYISDTIKRSPHSLLRKLTLPILRLHSTLFLPYCWVTLLPVLLCVYYNRGCPEMTSLWPY